MALPENCIVILVGVFLFGSAEICVAMTLNNSSLEAIGSNNDSANVSSNLISPVDPMQRRFSKDDIKSLASSTNSTTGNNQQKRSTGRVEILEAGSKTRGDARILKRGRTSVGAPGAPGGSGAPGTRFADSVFTLRNSINRIKSGYNSPVSFETAGGIPIIAIPGSNIPPPVYSYKENISPPAPPPSPSVTINGVGTSYGNPSPTVLTYRPSIGVTSTTAMPDIIMPPVTSGPGPKPIRPPTGTSVPIIGGGGGGGGSVLPPSPPPEEIFPPAPPPEEEEFDVGLGRRLKVSSGRAGGIGGGSGSPGGPGGIRANTRFVSKNIPTASRFSSKETFGPPSSLSAMERLRGGNGGFVRRERLRDKVKGFQSPIVEGIAGPLSSEALVDDPNIITEFVFSDIKCFKTRQNEYFGATIHMKSGFHLPYIRDRPQDPLTSEECRLDLVEGTRGSYHMSVTDLRGCGVEQCGEAMCLTMVFPRVPMLALADDEVTTIKCIPQKSTMSDTKSISFAGDSMENRRSSSTVEGGIQEFVAEVGVFRQNPGSANGLFVKRVNSGGVVQLGEPLQLRSVVRGTDGWKYSKLTDVKVWRMRDNLSPKLDNLDPNDASEVVTLVDPHGCRNEEYLVIAEDHPIRDPRNDMVHHFTFKAFLFRGQRVNEPLIVTARVHACQEAQDCVMECELRGRRKRSPVELHNASSIVHDYDTQLALRVVGLKDHPSSILDDEFPFEYLKPTSRSSNHTAVEIGAMTCNEKMFATGLGGGCVMLLICGLAFALYTYINQGKLQRNRKTQSSTAVPMSYRYPPPSGRPMGAPPYQKPLPPPPTSPSAPASSSRPQQSQNLGTDSSSTSNKMKNVRDESMSQMERLLKELVKNKSSNNKGNSSNSGGSKHKDHHPSEYACIDETNSSSTSPASSSEDLRKSKRAKDGVYILYCYDKEKKNKIMLPRSAPSSTRMRRKHLKQIERMAEEDDDAYSDDRDFNCERDEDSETMASQTEEPSDESDEYGEIGNNKGRASLRISNTKSTNAPCPIIMNQGVRRTVREVKKKSKQNNVLAYASTRSRGNIRRRISSVYREGYFNGLRGVVAAAVGAKGSFPLKYRKSPSTGNIPEALSEDIESGSGSYNHTAGKRINFSVRERRSQKSRRQQNQQKNLPKHNQEHFSSEGIISETTLSDMDSGYSGSNCSKLTEVYEMKRGGGRSSAKVAAVPGSYPDFRQLSQNRLDVQRQLMRGRITQGCELIEKQELRRTTSSPNNGENTAAVGLDSPPLTLGETKTTHFVTHDDSTTKILIVPETHV